jgi:hypothetical protein
MFQPLYFIIPLVSTKIALPYSGYSAQFGCTNFSNSPGYSACLIQNIRLALFRIFALPYSEYYNLLKIHDFYAYLY